MAIVDSGWAWYKERGVIRHVMGPHRCIDACSTKLERVTWCSYNGVRAHTRDQACMLITAVLSELTLNTESHLHYKLQTWIILPFAVYISTNFRTSANRICLFQLISTLSEYFIKSINIYIYRKKERDWKIYFYLFSVSCVIL